MYTYSEQGTYICKITDWVAVWSMCAQQKIGFHALCHLQACVYMNHYFVHVLVGNGDVGV